MVWVLVFVYRVFSVLLVSKQNTQMGQVCSCKACHHLVFPGAHLADGLVNIPTEGALTAS